MQTIPSNTLIHNRYLIVQQVGKGGQGAVYEAIDQRLDHRVALKQTVVSDYKLDKAFEREAKLLARLNHAALPRVTDYFQERRGQFLVMDFIPGDNLAHSLRRNGPFAVNYVLDWADQILDVLEYLHQQQPPVVHRDIKPQNLKLNLNGQVILLDFGLAKGEVGVLSPLSVGSSVHGYTRAYAPLEQVQGSGTDARSDLYALAATIYHFLAGKEPIDAVSRVATVWGSKPDPLRPIHQLNLDVPILVSQVLMHALAINADQRPASATQMRRALLNARQASVTAPVTGIAPLSQPATRAWLLPATFISILVLLLVALIILVSNNSRTRVTESATESATATVALSSPIVQAEDTATKIVESTKTVPATAAVAVIESTPTENILPVNDELMDNTMTPILTRTPHLTPTPTLTLTPTPLAKIVEVRASNNAVIFESVVGWGVGRTCHNLARVPSMAERLSSYYPNATYAVSQPRVEEHANNVVVFFDANSTETQACGLRRFDERVQFLKAEGVPNGIWIIRNAELTGGPSPVNPDPNIAQGGWVIYVEWK